MDVSNPAVTSYSVPRFKSLFLLGLVLGGGSFMILVSNIDPRVYIKNNREQGVYSGRQSIESHLHNNYSTIRTEGCRIPLMVTDDDSIRKMEKSIDRLLPCKPNPLLSSNKTHIWVEKGNMPHYDISLTTNFTCCYRSFYRPNSVDDITSSHIDDRVKYSDCRNFTDIIEVKDEFVSVICDAKKRFNYYFAFAREKKLITKPNENLPYNVLILGIDSVSRLNFHRTMPKTVTYLDKLGAVELLGYNKVGDNTFPNLMPLLLGKKSSELQDICLPNSRSTFDNCPFIWERFQRAGFATALAEDSSNLGTFNYAEPGFKGTPTDYYLHTFIHQAEENSGYNYDGNSNLCMNDNFFFKILLNYLEDLTLLKSKLFGFFWEITMSHDHLNYPMAMDDSFNELFLKMHASGYLNDTIIFLMSDHGMRWGKFRSTKQGFMEDRLPFVFALMPPSFPSKFNEAYNNLKLNSHRLTTPFDIHATLSDLSNLDNIQNAYITSRSHKSYSSNRGISLFLPIPGNRTCKSADIEDHWCTCYRNAEIIDPNSPEAQEAVKYVVSNLNSVLGDYSQCAKLSLAEVLEVTRLLPDSLGENKKNSFELTAVVQTNPGGGVFEATIGRDGGPGGAWSLAGSVSRLNLYGNQSYCVPTSQLKLYCYCINSTLTT